MDVYFVFPLNIQLSMAIIKKQPTKTKQTNKIQTNKQQKNFSISVLQRCIFLLRTTFPAGEWAGKELLSEKLDLLCDFRHPPSREASLSSGSTAGVPQSSSHGAHVLTFQYHLHSVQPAPLAGQLSTLWDYGAGGNLGS